MAVTATVTAAATMVVVISRQPATVAEAGRITAADLEAVVSAAVVVSAASAVAADLAAAVPEDGFSYELAKAVVRLPLLRATLYT